MQSEAEKQKNIKTGTPIFSEMLQLAQPARCLRDPALRKIELISCSPLRGKHEFMSSQDVEIFSGEACVERKDLNAEARCKLTFSSQWETTYLSYHHNTSRLTNRPYCHYSQYSTGCVSIAVHCSTLVPTHLRVTSWLMFT